jgi:hypothetical protein
VFPHQENAMPHTLRFIAVSASLVLGLLLIAWAVTGFSSFGMSGHGVAAMVLGVIFSTLVGVGLMALVFQSHRSHRDEAVDHGRGRFER